MQTLLHILDIFGVAVFAISGALAGVLPKVGMVYICVSL
jgi:uncharacterized membrane protein YeiH